MPLNDASDINVDGPKKKAPRKRSTSKENSDKGTKARSKTSTAKPAKPKSVTEKLLSPGSALARMNRQNILFGTSSQLALEESPTLVRQIQLALKESEVDADSSLKAPPLLQWPRLKAKGKRGLWGASSRDVEGGLLEQEDVYIPDFDRTQDFPLLMDGTNDGTVAPDSGPACPMNAPVVISSDAPTPNMSPQASRAVFGVEKEKVTPKNDDPVFDDMDEIDLLPPPSNQMLSQAEFDDIDDLLPPSAQAKKSPPRPRPPASGHSRRGRPTKSQSEIPTAMSNMRPQLTKTVSAPPTTPSKGSGRFVDIDEILDSEDDLMLLNSPTPPRVRSAPQSLTLYYETPTKRTNAKPIPNADVARVYRIPADEFSWINHKDRVFASITSHVRSLKPSSDPKDPNWHEKMLMYVPIILEDFRTYLNARTRIRTWRRATKNQTKAWNANLKEMGEGALVLVDGEDVLVVERELEEWQVRAWCESLAVCCILGDSRLKGTARRGFY